MTIISINIDKVPNPLQSTKSFDALHMAVPMFYDIGRVFTPRTKAISQVQVCKVTKHMRPRRGIKCLRQSKPPTTCTAAPPAAIACGLRLACCSEVRTLLRPRACLQSSQGRREPGADTSLFGAQAADQVEYTIAVAMQGRSRGFLYNLGNIVT